MYCKHCGNEIEQGQKFCGKCGRQLTSDVTENTDQSSSKPFTDRGGQDKKGPEKRTRRNVAIAIGACFVLAIALGAVYLATNSGQKKPDNDIESTLAMMTEANGGILPDIQYDASGGLGPRFITGCYTNRTISNADEAIASIADVAPLYGIADPSNEFIVDNEIMQYGTTVYRLQQCHQGIEIFGRELIISVDGNFKAASLSGLYSAGIKIEDNVPDSIPSGMDLVIWVNDNGEAEYALKAITSGGLKLYTLDFEQVLFESSTVDTETRTVPLIHDGIAIDIDVPGVTDGHFELADRTRNLVVFDANSKELSADRLIKDGKVMAGTHGFNLIWYGGWPFSKADSESSESCG